MTLARKLVSSLRRNVLTSLARIPPWAGGGEGRGCCVTSQRPSTSKYKNLQMLQILSGRFGKGTSTVISLGRIIKRLVSGAQSIVLRPLESSRLRVESFN